MFRSCLSAMTDPFSCANKKSGKRNGRQLQKLDQSIVILRLAAELLRILTLLPNKFARPKLMIFVQNRQTLTKRNQCYAAKGFDLFWTKRTGLEPWNYLATRLLLFKVIFFVRQSSRPSPPKSHNILSGFQRA